MKLYGFTFMRGVQKYDYPYIEMLQCLNELCEETYVALGESEDKTEESIQSFDLKITKTVWDDKRVGDGGSIFSEQANIALKALRAEHGDEDDAWAVFLHCDEIFHPNDYERLKSEIIHCDKEGFDAIEYRFMHFWGDHYHIAVNKRWHPSEIRAFKLKSPIECYGDAQGFHHEKKKFSSDIHLLHYGHVREKELHEAKQNEILKRIRPGEKFKKYKKREQKAFAQTVTQKVLFKHPYYLQQRIERLGDPYTYPKKDEVFIVGNPQDFSEAFKKRISAKKIHWVESLKDVPKDQRKENTVIVKPSFWQQLFYPSKVKKKMESPLAKDWDMDTYLLFKLSEKDIFVD